MKQKKQKKKQKRGFQKRSPAPLIAAAVVLLAGAIYWLTGIIQRAAVQEHRKSSLEYFGKFAGDKDFEAWEKKTAEEFAARVEVLRQRIKFDGGPKQALAVRFRDALPWEEGAAPPPDAETGWNIESVIRDGKPTLLTTLYVERAYAAGPPAEQTLNAAAFDVLLFGLSPDVRRTTPRWFMDGAMLYFTNSGEAWIREHAARRMIAGDASDPIPLIGGMFHSQDNWSAAYLAVKMIAEKYGDDAVGEILRSVYAGKKLRTVLEAKTGTNWEALRKQARDWGLKEWNKRLAAGPKAEWLKGLGSADAAGLANARRVADFAGATPAKSRAFALFAQEDARNGKSAEILSKDWQKVLSLSEALTEDVAVARAGLGDVKRAVGKKDQAEALYRLALGAKLNVDPDFRRLSDKLADVLWEMNRVEDAARLKTLAQNLQKPAE